MGWVETNHLGVTCYQCQEFNDSQVTQAVSSRDCGNLALHTGDDPNRVIERRKLWLSTLGLDLANLVSGVQIHGTGIALIDDSMKGWGAFRIDEAIPGTDALITKNTGIILATYTADCLPIFVYDPVTPAVGVVHAGWRGVIDGIAKLTVARMAEMFGTAPGDCLVAIGPSICGICFQVDRQLAERFEKVYPETVNNNEYGSSVDLQAFIGLEMKSIGVNSERIYESKLCTSCNAGRFFSYRAERGITGRIMGIIGLKHRISN